MMFCNYCPGYCCYRLPGSVLLIDAADINRLARYYGIRDGEVRRQFLEGKNTLKVKRDGSCIFQAPDKLYRRCTIHEARPEQCRRFPYGRPCPYLEREDLLAEILPRLEEGIIKSRQVKRVETEVVICS